MSDLNSDTLQTLPATTLMTYQQKTVRASTSSPKAPESAAENSAESAVDIAAKSAAENSADITIKMIQE